MRPTPLVLAALLVLAAPAHADLRPRLTLLASDSDLREVDFGITPHLGLDADTAELGGGVSLGARLSLIVQQNGEAALSLRDLSSRLLLHWRPQGWAGGEGLLVTVLPLDSERLYLGYEPLAAWGRSPFPGDRSAPALRLELARERWSAFVAAKSALVLNPLERVLERRLGFLAGGGAQLLPVLRVDVAGARFDTGLVPSLANLGIEEPSRTVGLSGRVALHTGSPVGPAVDVSRYRGLPEFFDESTPETYPEGLSTWLALELSQLSQRLVDPDVATPGAMRSQGATALALQGRAKLGFARVHALALYRSAAFLVSELPGLPPFTAFGESNDTQGERMLTLSGDYHFAGTGLTPGLLVRATLPASVEVQSNGVVRPLVIDERGARAVLPEGAEVGAVLEAKLSCRWDLGAGHVSVLGEVFLTHDPNRVTFRDDLSGVLQPIPLAPRTGGFSLYAQARF